MALLKSTTYVGADVFAADVDAPTFRRAVVNAQADVAEVLARATDKADADAIDHSAAGRGAPLGYPPASVSMGFGLRLSPSGAKQGGIDDEDLWFPLLVYVPAQEDTLVVDVSWEGSVPPPLGGLQVLDLTTDETYPVADEPVEPGVYRALVPVPTTAGLRALAVKAWGRPRRTVISDNPRQWVDNVVLGVRCHFGRGQAPGAVPRGIGVGVRVPAPGAPDSLAFVQVDEKHVEASRPLPGWLVTAIDGNLNGVEEWASGATAGGNGNYTATESALTDPGVDRFRSFTRKGHADEPLPSIPVASWSLGGQKANGDMLVNAVAAPTQGALESFAPFPTTGSKTTVAALRCHIPDMPVLSGGGWRAAALLGKIGASSGAWSATSCAFRFAGEAEVAATPVGIVGSTTTGPVALAEVAGLEDLRDVAATLEIALQRTSGTYAVGDHCLLAVCLWYAP